MIRASHLSNRSGTQPLEFAVFEGPQDLNLRQSAHLGNLVEEKSPSVRQLEFSLHGLLRPRKCAPLMTEELALEERIAHGRSVKCYEWSRGPRGRIVDRVSEKGLAGAGLSEKYDRHFGSTGEGCQTQTTSHRFIRGR